MAKLKVKYASMDEVPVNDAGKIELDPGDLYQEADGGGVVASLDAVGGLAIEDVGGMKTALADFRDTKYPKTKKALSAFEDLGKTPEQIKASLARLDAMADETKDTMKKSEHDAMLKQLTEKHSGELGKAGKKDELQKKQIAKLLIDSTATSALAKLTKHGHLALPHIRSTTRVEELEDGSFVARVLNKEGQIRVTEKSGSEPMGIKELVEIMKTEEQFAPIFFGEGSTGGGMLGSDSKPGGSSKITLTKEESRDVAAYRKAADQAKKEGKELVMLDS